MTFLSLSSKADTIQRKERRFQNNLSRFKPFWSQRPAFHTTQEPNKANTADAKGRAAD